VAILRTGRSALTILGGVAALIVALTWTQAAVADPAANVVNTTEGPAAGLTEGDLVSFRGIPYAQPPVGDLRWRPTAPAKAWTAALPATQFGSICAQPSFAAGPSITGGSAQSEDCLFLNVWKPKSAGKDAKLPVMVWIHGGAYQFGSGNLATSTAAQFTKDGVILVSMNYRLGRLGQFAHPALTAENPNGLLGNYALLDIISALHWVQDNIASFGGDPTRVTLFGISSGGGTINALTISPMGKGLFQRAIPESANNFPAWAYLQKPDGQGGPSAEQIGSDWATSVGATTAAQLRALPTAVAIRMATSMQRGGPVYIVDGKVLPDRVTDAYAAGRQSRVDYLTGSVSLEGTLIGAFPVPLDLMLQHYGARAQEARALYMPAGTPEKLATMHVFGDIGFVASSFYLAQQAANAGQHAYLYHFDYVPEALRGKAPGAGHGSEFPFIFDSFDPGTMVAGGYAPSAADHEMSRIVHAYWVNFAKTGDPNGRGLPTWAAYDASKDELLYIAPPAPTTRAGMFKERMQLTMPVTLAGPAN
jgi:para-nitrobenzyl esterase